jgi:hypothetical protein
MRRIIMLVTVALVMAAMMALSAPLAFAEGPSDERCGQIKSTLNAHQDSLTGYRAACLEERPPLTPMH